ncbi:YtzI protein [Bacillus thermotolerans]|uniref:YtzI protein n=1 Tax=Bacillus thermotolerans TaxID=1221996 RepID=A0A0F5I972_BACTR|nr:YtzI protein [Bacillus thermotolerans]KKB35230.1 hypothetical protein QY96_03665 [Bacillus thermotolerans]KKB37516.1 hypothetical protein QY97_03879 [Bacillus thermotolerans]KKB42056.1 hypothetical protein QY95_00405 [Bacillus thermotolerans]
MAVVMVISIIIIFAVIAMSVVAVNKAYKFKHTVDPIEEHKDHSSTVLEKKEQDK